VIKLFAIAFTCVYLHLSVGVVKTTHYCMGRESSFSLYSFEGKRCPCSLFLSNLEKKSCCSDSTELLVLDDDQTPLYTLSLNGPDYFFISELYPVEVIASPELVRIVNEVAVKEPPPLLKEPLYKTLCSYTLYEEDQSA
jgi:hypothetical protein